MRRLLQGRLASGCITYSTSPMQYFAFRTAMLGGVLMVCLWTTYDRWRPSLMSLLGSQWNIVSVATHNTSSILQRGKSYWARLYLQRVSIALSNESKKSLDPAPQLSEWYHTSAPRSARRWIQGWSHLIPVLRPARSNENQPHFDQPHFPTTRFLRACSANPRTRKKIKIKIK